MSIITSKIEDQSLAHSEGLPVSDAQNSREIIGEHSSLNSSQSLTLTDEQKHKVFMLMNSLSINHSFGTAFTARHKRKITPLFNEVFENSQIHPIALLTHLCFKYRKESQNMHFVYKEWKDLKSSFQNALGFNAWDDFVKKIGQGLEKNKSELASKYEDLLKSASDTSLKVSDLKAFADSSQWEKFIGCCLEIKTN